MVIQKSCYFLYLLTVIPLLIHKKKIRNSDIQINPSDIIFVVQFHVGQTNFNYTPAPRRGREVYCFTSVRPSILPSVQDIFRRIFLSFWTHQIPTSCLLTLLLIFIHIEHICSFFIAFFSATIDGRNLIFSHKLHIGTTYRGKRFWTHQIPTSCLPT